MLANQVRKYIEETFDLNGYEVIDIKQNTLFDIGHIEVKSNIYYLSFYKTDLSLDNDNDTDIDLSVIKSLSINLLYNISLIK